jgi:hypothetical protein
MRTYTLHKIFSLLAAFILSAGLLAQEKTEVSIQVKKDGKVVKDTTYEFDDAKEAKHVLKMVEIMSGEEHMEGMNYNYTISHAGEGHSKAMVFISEDGKKTKIKEISGDSLVWVSEGDGEHEIHKHGEHVVVMKKGDGESFDIWVDEDGDEDVKKKKIKVVVSEDDHGSWTAVSADETDVDQDVYILNGADDLKEEMKKIMEEYDGVEGANVKVIVTKKKVNKDK